MIPDADVRACAEGQIGGAREVGLVLRRPALRIKTLRVRADQDAPAGWEAGCLTSTRLRAGAFDRPDRDASGSAPSLPLAAAHPLVPAATSYPPRYLRTTSCSM